MELFSNILFFVQWKIIFLLLAFIAIGIPFFAFLMFIMDWSSDDFKIKFNIFTWIKIAILTPLLLTFYVTLYEQPSKNPIGAFSHWLVPNLIQSFDSYKKEISVEKIKNAPIIRYNHEVKVERYRLVSYNPPKHFYVTLKNVKTNEVFESVYVSKHCNSASSLKLGEEYNIRSQRYYMSNNPDQTRIEFFDLYNVFCE